MSEKFQNKYRISSVRLQNWDYGWNAPYFITICTNNREYFFGDIVDTPVLDTSTTDINNQKTKKMQLSEIGQLAEKYWFAIPEHFPFVQLGAFVVMPDHIHGIIIINKPVDGKPISKKPIDSNSITAEASKKWNPGTLGVIVNQYKRICTINARKINTDFAWQPRYYEHIIRDNNAFQRIETYINENPIKWGIDKPRKK